MRSRLTRVLVDRHVSPNCLVLVMVLRFDSSMSARVVSRKSLSSRGPMHIADSTGQETSG